LVEIKIKVPNKLNKTQKELLDKLKQTGLWVDFRKNERGIEIKILWWCYYIIFF
jgi:hypothetical protein